MSLSLTQNYTAVVPGANFVQFVASGGITPYAYSVVAGGAGGSINSATGAYTAPSQMTAYPASRLYDTIVVTDANLNTASATILIATPIFLVLDILQTQLQLPNDHVYLWDQKLFQPTDSALYVALSVSSCKPFGNNLAISSSDGSVVNQYISMFARLDFDVLSRGPAARDQKELVLIALNSVYSQQQQEANGFYLSKLPISGGFLNLSQIDGAAIPYRYKISFGLQYCTSFTQSVPYYDSFSDAQVVTNS